MQSKVGRFFIGVLLAAAAFLVYFLISNGIGVVVLFLISAVFAAQNPEMDPQQLENKLNDVFQGLVPTIFVLTTIVLVILFYAFFIFMNKNFKDYTRFKKIQWPFVMLSFFLGYALNMASIAVMELVPIPETWIEDHDQHTSFYGPVIFIILAVVVCAPLLEEIVFRGLIYTVLKKHSATWIAALISAVVFGAVHGNMLQAIYAGIMGLVCVYVYEMTESLLGSILVHLGFNATDIVNGLIQAFVGVRFDKLPSIPLLIASGIATAVMMVLLFNLNRKNNMHEIYIE